MIIKITVRPIYALIIFLFILLSAKSSFSQNLDKRISLKMKNATIAEVIDEISLKGQVTFSYSSQLIPSQKRITVKANNKTIKEILDEVFTDNAIDYSTVSGLIVLKPSVSKQEIVTKPANIKTVKHTISGYVRDEETKETMIGATVMIKNTNIGTYTNTYGFWSLTLPEGNYDIVFSYIGYKPVEEKIQLMSDILLNQTIQVMNMEIEAVVITSDNNAEELHSPQTGELKLTSDMINRIPGFAGSIDVVKSLHTVPGFTSFGDGSSKLYVRGGNSDQNLFLVDEAPVFNPSHLFGFFTAVAPDAIKDIKSYKGDFPAGYGGRLSSVISIRTKDGNMKRFGMSGSFNPFTSGISLEGPVIKEKCSYYIAYRKSNLEWITSRNDAAGDLEIKFNDLNARVNFQINNNNRVYLSLYKGNDDFSAVNTTMLRTRGISWENGLVSLRWNHIFNNKLFMNSTIYSSRYNYYLYFDKGQNEYWTSAIRNSSLKLDFSFYPNVNNTVMFGISAGSFFSDPGNVYLNDVVTQSAIPKVPKYYSNDFSSYVSNEMKVNDKLSLNYGLRLPVWRNTGPTKVFAYNVNYQVIDTTEYDSKTEYYRISIPEPRISIKYSTDKNSSVKASYCRTTQFIQLLSNSTSPFTSIEVWVPSSHNIDPQISDQFTLGYYRVINPIFNYSIEGFYRNFKNRFDYEDHANMLFNPYIEGELRFGKSWSYGAEFMFQKSKGSFNGWLSYTWSRVFQQIEGINNDNVFPASYDRPHNLSLNLSYTPTYRWAFSAYWFYMTGNPFTTPIGFYSYNNYTVPVYGDKNNDRLPDYHRLDLSLTYRINKETRKFKHNLVLAFYNTYARKNPISVNFNKIMDDNGNFVIPADTDGNNILVPTSISVAGIIPSLTYNFIF